MCKCHKVSVLLNVVHVQYINNKSVCALHQDSYRGMKQVLQFNSENELMRDQCYGCLSIAGSLASKQSLAAGRVHGEFKSLEDNVEPSLMISDEKITGEFLFLLCRQYFTGERLHTGGICQLRPAGSVLLDILLCSKNIPLLSFLILVEKN